MRANGYISILNVSGVTMDDYGEISAPETDWSEPIPCHIKTNSDTSKGEYDGGNFRQASFQILVERQLSASIKRIRLERFDEELGEYDIISIEPIPGRGRTQIIV